MNSDLGISFAAAAVGMRTFADGLNAAMAERSAETALYAVTRPDRLPRVLEEVVHRTALYAEYWPQRPEAPPRYTTPRCAALRSVAEDVARGFLG